MKKTIAIIGSGFSALAASCYLAQQGNKVTVYEKNDTIGGRARQFKKEGFTFDMGPSWYWMPDVFERFFQDFNKKTTDYYELIKLNPAYRVYFGVDDFINIYDNLEEIKTTFESIEKGSGQKLETFIRQAKSNYDIAIKDLVYRPGVSPLELITVETTLKLNQFFSTVSTDIHKKFKNERLIQILEFPVLFLGAKPTKTPSFYNFMNYADFGLGTWHPKTGMFDVVRGIEKMALELGVTIETNSVIEKIIVENKTATAIIINGKTIKADIILSGADYHHTETLLDIEHRAYSEQYWESRVFAPSSLLFFVGFNKKIENISHHALFFDVDFNQHAADIYDEPKWPEAPLFYANFPSKTDLSAAPEGMESSFFLIPLAPGINDSATLREEYFEKIITRFEKLTKQEIKNNIIFKRSFCKNDFVNDYNAYKGNAYGMANTLLQTAFLRPKLKSKKVRNLYFTGQLTVPGPGVPPALISGKLVAELIQKSFRS
ncbi:phytoene dehydrogenase [Flavobacterium aquidurense]|jgi:phytoene desaturase|uniref:phytoene desaturase family protein n=1 Tax=Flavobacterium aquidurense TaxID=362413 RepID=UPI00091DEE5A|nr:phytoene desaturase family protein [Flavobacterium aquidurense]OXA71186.1 phytoene dehydrogenase [Flavobacterium aquidurense]SHG67430.1 phytoene desaturase [Flavobacterium frigidimaris]